jgi:hypothetical protein
MVNQNAAFIILSLFFLSTFENTKMFEVSFLWVHGFNGGETTFKSVPLLLSTAFDTKYVKPFTYSSKESFYSVANNLYKFIKKHITDKRVFLLGHSCGGLLIGEALKNFSTDEKKAIMGIALFDVPFGGVDLKKLSDDTLTVSNAMIGFIKEYPGTTATLGVGLGVGALAYGAAKLFGGVSLGVVDQAIETIAKATTNTAWDLIEKSDFWNIVIDTKKLDSIVKSIQSLNIPIFKVNCREDKTNYLYDTKHVWKSAEEHEFIIQTVHPLTHMSMFLDLDSESVYKKQQLELYNKLVSWIKKVLKNDKK